MLYLGVAGAIVWFRFPVPARQALRHRMRVEAVHQEAPGVVSILITGAHLAELKAEAGQRCAHPAAARDEGVHRGRRKVLLVAGGTGITPLRALLESVPAGELTVLYRSSRDTDVVFAHELTQIAADRGASVHHPDREPGRAGARPLDRV